MIGETVLLQIDSGIFRPLLVVVVKEGLVSGELYLNWETDWTEYLRTKLLPCRPGQLQRSFWVKGLKEGTKLGEWKRIGDPTRLVQRRKV